MTTTVSASQCCPVQPLELEVSITFKMQSKVCHLLFCALRSNIKYENDRSDLQIIVIDRGGKMVS